MKKSNENCFEGRLVLSRQRAGMTQKEVANELGMESKSYAKYEQGKAYPPYERLLNIVDVLDVTPNYLFWGEINVFDNKLSQAFKECPEEKKEELIRILYEILQFRN